ncbi:MULTISPECIES: 4-hydroxy-tetrahydrodipicolinate synthase [Deefgea]|uniref:4-hydroxy-tetrahydrodipicolinate synthase n=1 Tax=Deefgea chitinilytica TaxID=570276 RepID=A0ABS2C7M7_9NEIS|nr:MULTISPECIES: 4-hydroxy-tetrahydrodipicolinate synthase [Deefgea]MBM5570164.1 4-hydroxy-tetrahydrodipicolinate synthase [Deefgea chitinilytica]MBM9887393.1 4-hydroxy-tetrahydrodipicolinate synthase [Deefgea sp. CFH1-16]
MTSVLTPQNTALWTAIITPMLADGAIDFATFTKLLREQESVGNGVVLLGSTGEGSNLSIAERQAVVQHACSLNLAIPLMVGVGGLDLPSQLEWLAFCETQPVSSYLLVTPIYAKPGVNGQRRWFEALLNAVSKPCMLYNIPSRAGVPLAEGAIAGLLGHTNLWAVKESGGNAARFAELKAAYPQIAWYSGDDVLFAEHAVLGAAGLVSVASNVWPQQVANWVKQGLAGEAIGDALRLASETLFIAPSPIPTKAIMHHQGRIASNELRLPLCAEDLLSLLPILEQDQQLAKLA